MGMYTSAVIAHFFYNEKKKKDYLLDSVYKAFQSDNSKLYTDRLHIPVTNSMSSFISFTRNKLLHFGKTLPMCILVLLCLYSLSVFQALSDWVCF